MPCASAPKYTLSEALPSAEQHLYCALSDCKIERADLLCSGFRPR